MAASLLFDCGLSLTTFDVCDFAYLHRVLLTAPLGPVCWTRKCRITTTTTTTQFNEYEMCTSDHADGSMIGRSSHISWNSDSKRRTTKRVESNATLFDISRYCGFAHSFNGNLRWANNTKIWGNVHSTYLPGQDEWDGFATVGWNSALLRVQNCIQRLLSGFSAVNDGYNPFFINSNNK